MNSAIRTRVLAGIVVGFAVAGLIGALAYLESKRFKTVTTTSTPPMPPPTTTEPVETPKYEMGLSTEGADLPFKRQYPLFMVMLKCTDEATPSWPLFANTMRVTNAIFLRSGADFKWSPSLSVLETPVCIISRNQTTPAMKFMEEQVNTHVLKINNGVLPSFYRVVVIGEFDSDSLTRGTQGFAMLHADKAYVRIEATLATTTVFAHELGHTMGLMHPMNDDQIKLLDLPRVCTRPVDRAQVLSSCPTKLRTCDDATEDEDLTNVMDYLPDRCAAKFHFSPMQVFLMHRKIEQS